MSRWFRFYDCVLDDPKVQALPAALFKCWVNILCVASKGDGRLPPVAQLAFLLRKGERAMAADLAELRRVGLLDEGDDGLAPHNWASRQFRSDSSNDRVKRFRDRKKAEIDAPCNVTSPVTETAPEYRVQSTDTEIIPFPPQPVAGRGNGMGKGEGGSRLGLFPSDGSIEFTPWADVVRAKKRNIDVNATASAFRKFCHEKDIPLNRADIAQVFGRFCEKHRVQ